MIDDVQFFETLVEKGSDAIISIDEGSTILYANESVADVFGYDPDELVGEPLTAVMPERFQGRHHEAVAEYLETGERGLDWTDVQLPGEHADGHEVPLSITFEEHTYDGERIFSGIIRDVTRQKEYERTLEALQETARDLLRARHATEIGEIAVTTAAEVFDLPMAAVFVHDATSDELRPVAQSEAVDEEIGALPPLPVADSLAGRAFRSGESSQYDDVSEEPAAFGSGLGVRSLLAVPLGDRGVFLAGSTEPGALDDRGVDLAHVLAANVEAALLRAHREAELERQNERLERFASILSHDLRDPLNAAQAQVALARNEHDSEYLAELEDIHDRMGELVEEVLTLTREGQTVSETSAVDVESVAAAAWTTAGVETAALETERIGTIRADPERFRTLLENLFGNAVRHAGSDVTVRVGPLSDGGGFYVADDGPGIPEGERSRVLEHGYTTSEDGSGLGLNIVKSIAEAHGWDVSVTASETDGARFEFRFADVPARNP